MSNQSSDYSPELELQLVETSNENDKSSDMDLITQYRILEKRCDEALKKIQNRRTKKN